MDPIAIHPSVECGPADGRDFNRFVHWQELGLSLALLAKESRHHPAPYCWVNAIDHLQDSKNGTMGNAHNVRLES